MANPNPLLRVGPKEAPMTWHDMTGILAQTFHVAGLTSTGVTDEQIVHTLYALTGWFMEYDYGGDDATFIKQVRTFMEQCEKNKEEMMPGVIAGSL